MTSIPAISTSSIAAVVICAVAVFATACRRSVISNRTAARDFIPTDSARLPRCTTPQPPHDQHNQRDRNRKTQKRSDFHFQMLRCARQCASAPAV